MWLVVVLLLVARYLATLIAIILCAAGILLAPALAVAYFLLVPQNPERSQQRRRLRSNY